MRAETDGCVTLVARTPFVRDWVQRHYVDRIRDLWQKESGVVNLDIIASKKPIAEEADDTPMPKAVAKGSRFEDSFGSSLDPRYTFDSFVVGKSNELAYAAARRISESTDVHFNPLFLHGGVGLGKTHLMHAIASEMRRKHPERKVMYMSAEKFMFQFISALRYKDTVAFKKQFRSVDLLMIDHVQFIANKNTTQEEFFHTF
ncbi:MAG: ATP-binding protein, partial [Sphingomonadales bacterium]|nr:ATP-binding protein [Sphingomonadales bacterium]